jgi:hypothetical protein
MRGGLLKEPNDGLVTAFGCNPQSIPTTLVTVVRVSPHRQQDPYTFLMTLLRRYTYYKKIIFLTLTKAFI